MIARARFGLRDESDVLVSAGPLSATQERSLREQVRRWIADAGP